MNKNALSLVLFAARSFIVGFTIYLILTAAFFNNFHKIEKVAQGLEAKATLLEQQGKFIAATLSVLMSANNPEGLYLMAMGDEQNGKYPDAIAKIAMAMKLGQQNLEKYQMKLNQLKGAWAK